MNIGLFEDWRWTQLLPLVWMRSPFELRCGREYLIDKVRKHLGEHVAGTWLRDSVRPIVTQRMPLAEPLAGEPWCLVNARVLVTGKVLCPPPGAAWVRNGDLIAATLGNDGVARLPPEFFLDESRVGEWLSAFRVEPPPEGVTLIDYPWDLMKANASEVQSSSGKGGVIEGKVDDGAHLLSKGDIHIARGARIMPGVVLDAEDGPIDIEEGVRIEPNAFIQGPCYIGRNSIVRAAAVIREGTTIGPVCKVGGEVEASLLLGYSNKQHDGFLGHSVVAEWVNLGADTVTSDLKNTYGSIRVAINGVGVETGQHFVGTTIGDHAKTGIGTILPTGCVIGVASNVFTPLATPKFVPSFAWLTDAGLSKYRIEKAITIARTVMGRRDRHLGDVEKALLEHVAREAPQVESAGWQ